MQPFLIIFVIISVLHNFLHVFICSFIIGWLKGAIYYLKKISAHTARGLISGNIDTIFDQSTEYLECLASSFRRLFCKRA